MAKTVEDLERLTEAQSRIAKLEQENHRLRKRAKKTGSLPEDQAEVEFEIDITRWAPNGTKAMTIKPQWGTLLMAIGTSAMNVVAESDARSNLESALLVENAPEGINAADFETWK